MNAKLHKVVLSIGSNIEPEQNIARSQQILQQETRLLGVSSLIQTAPDGFQDQPDFINGAFYLETELDYHGFNAYLKALEQRLGRVKGPIKSGPRTIDLDIILWDGEVMHSDFYHKHYVIEPLQELIEKYEIVVSETQQ